MEAEIVVRVQGGNLSIRASTHDKVALLGLLELAKASVLAQPPPDAVRPPPPGLARQLIGG